MHKLRRAAILFAWLIVFLQAGCKGKTVPATAKPIDQSTATVAVASDQPTEAPTDSSKEKPVDGKLADGVLAKPSTEEGALPSNMASPAQAIPSQPDPGSPTVTPADNGPPATWTSQRLVLMGSGGPRFIKLDLNIGHHQLDEGFRRAMSDIAKELSLDFEKPIEWKALLDQPIIASGWLGNLVPGPQQRDQLRALYDSNKNELVDEAEWTAFLTRGLSRIRPLRVVARPAATRIASASVWGPIDLDGNGELSKAEIAHTSESMLRYDFDGDHILTVSELTSVADTGSDRMGGGAPPTLLDQNQVVAWDIDKPQAMADAIVDAYSFTEELASETLFSWSPERLKGVDANEDAIITAKELQAISDKDIDASFRFSFPDVSGRIGEEKNVSLQTVDPVPHQRWMSHPGGGRLKFDGCILTILLNDEQSSSVRKAFQEQFARIENDAQLQAFAMQALELKEGAIELLKSEASKDQEATNELAWRWLVRPRHWHLQLAWSLSDNAWLEMMDANGDQKLVLSELDQFATQAGGLDRDKNGVITAEEMPVSILLEVRRAESRGLRSRLGGTAVEKRGANVASAPTWFTGMDYNSDGELSQSEFFGDQADFEKLDLDRNGIIEAREVTTPQ